MYNIPSVCVEVQIDPTFIRKQSQTNMSVRLLDVIECIQTIVLYPT